MSAAHQLEIEVLYNLQFESASSMFDLRDVATYIARRVGLIPRRVWFGAGSAVNVAVTAKQRRNLLRFLRQHRLNWYLVLDDFHKRQPIRLGRAAGERAVPCEDFGCRSSHC